MMQNTETSPACWIWILLLTLTPYGLTVGGIKAAVCFCDMHPVKTPHELLGFVLYALGCCLF